MRFALFGIAALFSAAPTSACIVTPYEAVIHRSLPPILPADTFVAKVTIEAGDGRNLFRNGLRARVHKVVQGDPGQTAVLLKLSIWGSCSEPFANGRSGYIVGVPRGYEEGLLIVDPIEVDREDGFRLPDGYQVPASKRLGKIVIDNDAIERANRPQP